MSEQRESFRDSRIKTHGTLTRDLAESLRVDRAGDGVDKVLKEMGNDFNKASHRAVAVVMRVSGGRPQGIHYVARGKNVEFEPVEAAKLFKEAKKGVIVRVSTKYLTQVPNDNRYAHLQVVLELERLTFPDAGGDRNVSHWLRESEMEVSYTFEDPEGQEETVSIGADQADRAKHGLLNREVAARAVIRMDCTTAHIRVGLAPTGVENLKVSTISSTLATSGNEACDSMANSNAKDE